MEISLKSDVKSGLKDFLSALTFENPSVAEYIDKLGVDFAFFFEFFDFWNLVFYDILGGILFIGSFWNSMRSTVVDHKV